ncbi:LysR family transcriptional regulator [Kitasatospora camelliae]|uniref:LysR family transcriptional regulator n=1 Tax=Kitasatospora camelliae TaxID=3156397 RepID=A0AAU8K1M8_9ACTN
MDIDTRLLRYFAAVHEEGQLTGAAARLSVRQPTLTRQIRQLEAQLGVELFHRSRAGMTPTAAGAALAERVGPLLADWTQAVRAAQEAADPAVGTLRVGFEGSIINLIGRSTIEDFGRRMPGWRVRLRQNNWFDPTSGLGTGEIDLTLWHAPSNITDRYACADLGSEERWAVLPADHRLADREELDLAELLDEEFVAGPREAAFWRDFWLAAEERRGHPVRIGAVAHNADEWLTAVACGQGIGFAPRSMSQLAPRPDVVHRPVRGLSPCRVGLYWPLGRPATPAMAAFVRSCRATVRVDGTAGGTAGGTIEIGTIEGGTTARVGQTELNGAG